ncbi:MAG TPA: hypothetical protein VFS40_05250 [Gemmatimonadales bacterium]|nr:hypothetical protein [Gemmatimonadales bacterium]
MSEFLASDQHFRHFLAAVILLGRVGDLASTWYATPTLHLEANPLVRRFRWRLGLLSLLLALVPYYNTSLGMVVAVPSLLVTAGNLGRGWLMRALGEAEYWALLLRAARQHSRRAAMASALGAAAFFALAAGLLRLLSSPDEWGYWFADGMLLYTAAVLVHGTAFLRRLYREAAGAEVAEVAGRG